MSRTIKTFFMLSMLLNIALIGLIGGHIYKRWNKYHAPAQSTLEQFSPETRNLVGRTLQNSFKDMQPLGDEMRKKRASLLEILTADEFDEAAFDKVTQELDDIRVQMKDLKIETTKELAKTLPPEERKAFAKRMAKMVGGGFKQHVNRERNIEKMGRHDKFDMHPRRKPIEEE